MRVAAISLDSEASPGGYTQMIELRDISKRFGTRPGLERINLRFERGQTHVLLGLSGCGKSTLLRLIMGLAWPDSGQVIINGARMTAENQREQVRAIGYVVQDGGLFPHLTAEENVSLVARVMGRDRDSIEARLRELSSLVALERSTLRRHPKELSGGQRQRVGLMRALMLDPPLLLLDEPLGALDPIARSALRGELKSIFDRLHKTVVLVTHDLDEAAFFARSVTLIREGRVEQNGELADLALRPVSAFVTEFINAQKPSSTWMKELQ